MKKSFTIISITYNIKVIKNAPSAKQAEPIANKIPIHQPIAPGAHHAEPILSSPSKQFK